MPSLLVSYLKSRKNALITILTLKDKRTGRVLIVKSNIHDSHRYAVLAPINLNECNADIRVVFSNTR